MLRCLVCGELVDGDTCPNCGLRLSDPEGRLLPYVYQLLELYRAGRLEELNVALKNWHEELSLSYDDLSSFSEIEEYLPSEFIELLSKKLDVIEGILSYLESISESEKPPENFEEKLVRFSERVREVLEENARLSETLEALNFPLEELDRISKEKGMSLEELIEVYRGFLGGQQ